MELPYGVHAVSTEMRRRAMRRAQSGLPRGVNSTAAPPERPQQSGSEGACGVLVRMSNHDGGEGKGT
jgi:hypothetical protein